MGVFDFWKKPSFIYNFDFNYFFVYRSFDTIRIMLLRIPSSLIAEWLWYRSYNPETWVRFPEGMTSFHFTWNKNYTDTRSAGGKIALFILFNDSPCFPESTTPRTKFEKNIWYPKMAKNDGKFSLRIQRAPKNFSRSLMFIWHLLSHI